MKIKTADATLHFRLKDNEKEVIINAAKESGQSLSDYARTTLLAASDFKALPVPEQDVLLAEKESKKEIHSIRTTKAEWKFYQRQADRIGCSVSEYIRMCSNGKSITVIPGLPDVARQIAKVGVNLNQLTMLAHQGRIKEIDLFSTNDSLKQILKQLNRLARKDG